MLGNGRCDVQCVDGVKRMLGREGLKSKWWSFAWGVTHECIVSVSFIV